MLAKQELISISKETKYWILNFLVFAIFSRIALIFHEKPKKDIDK